MPLTNDPRVIVALDFANITEARDCVAKLDSTLCRLKVGNILFTHYGPAFVEELMKKGFDIFLDLKFHDIPQTVAGACRSAAELGVWMTNLHMVGGRAMCVAAVDAIANFHNKPLLVGVTVLTSMDAVDLANIGWTKALPQRVAEMADLARDTGLDGVVCSSAEVGMLRQQLAADFLLVTPGIRLATYQRGEDDQKRVMTPEAAMAAGASYLVIGRPITKALDPLAVLTEINHI